MAHVWTIVEAQRKAEELHELAARLGVAKPSLAHETEERWLAALLFVHAAAWHDRSFVARIAAHVDELTGSRDVRDWARRRMAKTQNVRFQRLTDELVALSVPMALDFSSRHRSDLGVPLDAGLDRRHAIAHEQLLPTRPQPALDFWEVCVELDVKVAQLLAGTWSA